MQIRYFQKLSILMLMFGVKKLENLHHSELMVALVQEQRLRLKVLALIKPSISAFNKFTNAPELFSLALIALY